MWTCSVHHAVRETSGVSTRGGFVEEIQTERDRSGIYAGCNRFTISTTLIEDLGGPRCFFFDTTGDDVLNRRMELSRL